MVDEDDSVVQWKKKLGALLFLIAGYAIGNMPISLRIWNVS